MNAHEATCRLTSKRIGRSTVAIAARARLIAAAAAVGVGALLVLLLASTCGPVPTAAAQPLGRGIIDNRLEQSTVDASAVPAMVAEMGSGGLRATWTRVMVHWTDLQPHDPALTWAEDADDDGYADAYVARLDDVVGQLSAASINVILTMVDVPKWASDKDYWGSDGYESRFAPDLDKDGVSAAFRGVGAFLAARYSAAGYAGRVRWFECWNEPNQGRYLSPQTPASETNGGAKIYLDMLKLWYRGVKSGSSTAVVIGGATAPRGRGDGESTPPQAFARYLKGHGATEFMDAYSHHPYTPGGSRLLAPGQLPNNLRRCVTLGNLNVIMKLFPKIPFFLTEFGYNTQDCSWFGVTVSKATQARYLRTAYSYTDAHFSRVVALLWYLVDDWNPSGKSNDDSGVYMGVRSADGVRKPSWYAFARGNSLSITAPAAVSSGRAFTISGKLTYRMPESPERQTLTLQSRRPSATAWTKVAAVRTAVDGAYSCTVKQKSTRVYRIIWGGVCESAKRKVATR